MATTLITGRSLPDSPLLQYVSLFDTPGVGDLVVEVPVPGRLPAAFASARIAHATTARADPPGATT